MTTNTEATATDGMTASPNEGEVRPKPKAGSRKSRSKRRKTGGAKKESKTKSAKGIARKGSKTARVLALLQRPNGVSLKELMKATGWQPHSVRGFLSGTVGKKMGRTVQSSKSEGGERTYTVKA